MKILVTGATGFVGRALVQRLQREGHQVLAWVRSPGAARNRLGPAVQLVPVAEGDAALVRALEQADGVVNLAGENLFSGRWTRARKEELVTSRVDLTEELVRAMSAAARRPAVLVSASAVGLYGDRGEEVLDETSAPADDFLADLCRRWEAAAAGATALGVRVTCPRIGIVLGSDGGALAQMLPPFLMGVGGRLGSGRQRMSWIHLDDLVELLVTALQDRRFEGPFNATAPGAVSNLEFTRTLGRQLDRPTIFPVPGFALRLVLGEAAGVLLGGQEVRPARAQELGYTFRHPELAGALEEIFSHGDTVEIARAGELPDHAYVRERGAHYRLRQEVLIDAPLEEVADFFSRPANLGALSPSWVGWSPGADPGPEVAAEGARISHRVRLGPLPLTWVSEIVAFRPGRGFTDVQLRGPYKSWHHRHRFEPAPGGGTRVVDEVHYRVGWGPLGWLAHALGVKPSLKAIFGYRHEAMRRRFGAPGSRAAARLEEAA